MLIPFEQADNKFNRFDDDLMLGRLPEFCPEAFSSGTFSSTLNQPNSQPENSSPTAAPDTKRQRKQQLNFNLMTEPQIPLPPLDSILKDKLDRNLSQKVNLH